MYKIFLGGTCANNRWREDIVIPALLRGGVPEGIIFNPNLGLDKWNEEAQSNEAEVKKVCSLLVYYIGDTRDGTGISFYSGIKAMMALYDHSERAYIVLDVGSTDGHTKMALIKAFKDLKERFPHAMISDNLQELIEYIVCRYSLRSDTK